MPTDERPAAASLAAAPWVIAAAVVVTTLAAMSLLDPHAGHAARAKGTVVSTGKTSLGRILVDSRGRTLYMFGPDRNGKSACAGMCATFWPPLIAHGNPHAVGGAKASLLGTTKRSDGLLQVTYDNHPLYGFFDDRKKGQANAEGVHIFGGVWHAVPAGSQSSSEAFHPRARANSQAHLAPRATASSSGNR